MLYRFWKDFYRAGRYLIMEESEVKEYLEDGAKVRLNLDYSLIYHIGREIGRQIIQGKKLLIFGNGGSAADAQHIAAEFVGRFEKERKALPAIALHANTSSLTAIANDYGYDEVFARQIEAYASKGDIAIGISTSGNSKNVIKALEKAKELGCITIALTGSSGGKLNGITDYIIKVQSDRTSIIQEAHITIGHIISKIVEDML